MPLLGKWHVYLLPFAERRALLSFLLSIHNLENKALSGKTAFPNMWRVLHERTGHFPPGRMHHAGTLAVCCPARTARIGKVPRSSSAMCEAKITKGERGSLDTVAGRVDGHMDDELVEGVLPTS